MAKKVIQARRLLKRRKIQSILQHWRGRQKKWIRSCDLRKEFVKGEKKPEYVRIPPSTSKIRQMPKYLYNCESEMYRHLIDMNNAGILEHKEIPKEKGKPESYYRPSKKYKFEPLKFFYEDILEECTAHNTYQFHNSTLFSPAISSKDLTLTESSILESSMQNIIESYSSVNLLFREIGLRRANEIWKKRLRSLDISPPTKLYIWIKLIGIHYLATLDYAEKNECYMRGEVPHVDIYIVTLMNNRNFEPPFPLYYHGIKSISKEWQLSFLKMMDSAFHRYLTLKDISFDKEKIDEELNKVNIVKIFDDTLSMRANAESFLIVNHPEFLPIFESKEPGEEIKSKNYDIWDASTLGFMEKEKTVGYKEQKSKPSFFDMNEFFSGVVNDELVDIEIEGTPDEVIEHVRCEKEKEFYNELRMLANTFEVPALD